jgi:hypothetical protein
MSLGQLDMSQDILFLRGSITTTTIVIIVLLMRAKDF